VAKNAHDGIRIRHKRKGGDFVKGYQRKYLVVKLSMELCRAVGEAQISLAV
jgi:hypothetical protein